MGVYGVESEYENTEGHEEEDADGFGDSVGGVAVHSLEDLAAFLDGVDDNGEDGSEQHDVGGGSGGVGGAGYGNAGVGFLEVAGGFGAFDHFGCFGEIGVGGGGVDDGFGFALVYYGAGIDGVIGVSLDGQGFAGEGTSIFPGTYQGTDDWVARPLFQLQQDLQTLHPAASQYGKVLDVHQTIAVHVGQ